MLPTLHAAAHLTGLNPKTAETSKEDVKKKCEILMCKYTITISDINLTNLKY